MFYNGFYVGSRTPINLFSSGGLDIRSNSLVYRIEVLRKITKNWNPKFYIGTSFDAFGKDNRYFI